MDVKGKVAIITGASAGIGLETARVLAGAGAKVVAAARSTDKLAALVAEIKQQGNEAIAVTADMTNLASIQNLVAQAQRAYGRIDILVNNAGQAAAGTVAEASLDNFRKIMELNVFGVVAAIQAVVPVMRQNQGGVIVNVSSRVSKMHIPGLGTYAATKSALNMLSDTARVELAGDNIRVITVFPRMTATDFGKNSLGDERMRQQQRAAGPQTGAPPPVDSADHVARRILLALETEPEEQYMEDSKPE